MTVYEIPKLFFKMFEQFWSKYFSITRKYWRNVSFLPIVSHEQMIVLNLSSKVTFSNNVITNKYIIKMFIVQHPSRSVNFLDILVPPPCSAPICKWRFKNTTNSCSEYHLLHWRRLGYPWFFTLIRNRTWV